MNHLQRIQYLRERLANKLAFAPAQPPMDPAMMAAAGGGAPPMDPAMMAAAGGGAPPMDPAMMAAAGGGMPPMDPAMMPAAGGGMPQMSMEDMAALAQQLGISGGGQQGQGGGALEQKVDAIGLMLVKLIETLGIDMEDGQGAPPQEQAPIMPPEDETSEGGVGGPGSMESVEEDPNQQVLSNAVKEGGSADSYIARQLRKMRR